MRLTQWHDIATEAGIRDVFARHGVKSFYLKELKRNHNSKNQIYVAPDLSDLALIPTGTISSNDGTSTKARAGAPIFHAPLRWLWANSDSAGVAPGAQLIYYPQYPEVRLSGLLQESPHAPRELLSIDARGQEPGRLLMFGSDGKGAVVAQMASASSPAGISLSKLVDPATHLALFPVDPATIENPDERLRKELARIHMLGWIDSSELHADGTVHPCSGPRCGGHTLEAQMGIPMNGAPEPDFGEWEIKSHRVARFDKPAVGRVTLFTPEPNEGAYADNGVGWFAEHFGRLNDVASRYDFTGVHISGAPHATTGLELVVDGYDSHTREMKSDGMVALLSPNGAVVSGWTFAKLLEHWQRKHAFAAYVPAKSESGPPSRFAYGNLVHLARHTRFEMFLHAMTAGLVVYDPGIKSERQQNGTWRAKARSQFRINFRDLSTLYLEFEEINVLS